MWECPQRSRRSLLRDACVAASGAWTMGGSLWGKMIEGREIVVARGAVATEPEEAARAGARILEAGGNAVDAAACAALACGVLLPQLSGIGGYVLAGVVLEGSTGKLWAIDANSAAPARAHERMYETGPPGVGVALNRNEYQCSVRDDANVHGPLAVGVPGELAGIGTLQQRWGRLKWPQVVAPVQRLLADGIPFAGMAQAIADQQAILRKYEDTARLLLPEGAPPRREDLWRPRDLEKTFARLASAGWRDFYEGEIGRRIADSIQRLGGWLTREDMARYQPRIVEPYSIPYRNATVYSAVLANGGITCLEALNMLERFEVAPESDPAWWHRLAEVLKLAWRDRLRYAADPGAVPVPIERLLSKEYAAGRVETLRQFPSAVDSLPGPPAADSPGTTHISAGDSDGNLVAITVTHGGMFGSCVTVPGAGILLAHGMSRFDPRPGRANSVGPGKRPLNNVCPTIVRLPERDVALGLRGGRRIVSVATQLIARIVDHGAGPLEASIAPRLHVEEHEPLEITSSAPAQIAARLEATGHRMKKMATVGGWAHLVERSPQTGKIRAGSAICAAGIE